jgi:hypothetical protein
VVVPEVVAAVVVDKKVVEEEIKEDIRVTLLVGNIARLVIVG